MESCENEKLGTGVCVCRDLPFEGQAFINMTQNCEFDSSMFVAHLSSKGLRVLYYHSPFILTTFEPGSHFSHYTILALYSAEYQ